MTLAFDGLVTAMNHIRASGNDWPLVRVDLKGSHHRVHLTLSRDGQMVTAKLPGPSHAKIGYLRRRNATWFPGVLEGTDRTDFWEVVKGLSQDPVATLAAQGKRLARENGELAFCAICGHPLSNDASVERGIGPECWLKLGSH